MRRPSVSLSLFARVISLVTIGLLLMFAGFALLSLQAVRDSTQRTMQERLLIAQITAQRVDDLLREKVAALQTGVEQNSVDPDHASRTMHGPELAKVGQHLGDFVLYIALLDRQGTVVWTEPYMPDLVGADLSSNRYIAQVLSSGKSLVSGFLASQKVEPSAAILTATKRADGSVNGLVYAAVNLRHPSISQLLGPLGLGKTGYAEIVDEEGFPLASTWEEQSWQNCRYGDRFETLIRERGNIVGQCHDCHTNSRDLKKQDGVMAFASLSNAPWGIVVQQDETEAMAYSRSLEQNLFLFGAGALFITLVVAWVLTRSVVRPIQSLTAECQRIAAGDLARPISPLGGGGEVSALARSFNTMREKLKSSLNEIQDWNQELERRVEKRTTELDEAEQGRRELLRKLVVAQEEERRALARELHDETSQALTALVVGLETATTAPAESVAEMKKRMDSIKPLATNMLREIQRIILALRPAILDDLGLVQAIDWFAESRLESQGVSVSLETIGVEKRLPSEVETVVFRIAQEAISNIARHAKAETVSIMLDFRDALITLEVEDDGRGFSPDGVLARRGDSTSLGLMGIRERVALFGGKMQIESQPGQGTRFVAAIPVNGAPSNGPDTRSARR
ncbi:MAG: HAMP domain-containing protein [Chloroflexi bacterium]|nr:HAMP domain-containing protein [Chloroflexota bacterium]